MKTLLLESVAGVAGDMFTASFIDAGLVEVNDVARVPELLGLRDVEVSVSRRTTAGMSATHLEVVEKGRSQSAGGSADHDDLGKNPRTFMAIDRRLSESGLDDPAKRFARSVFRLLAEAEADAHGVDVESVHFHEVGAVDSIVDVAMAGVAVAGVNPDRVLATPVKLGRGTIRIAHGLHSVPPPASARLARGFEIAEVPLAIERADVELSTPTGLAILRALAPTFTRGWPAGRLVAQGMGCGTMDLGSYPNAFRCVLLEGAKPVGEACAEPSLPYAADSVVEICCNVDDESPERTAWAAEQLLKAGALDVWTAPVTGKKGRAAVCISVLSGSSNWPRLADWMLRHTTTFGIRYRTWDRLKLERFTEMREVDGEPVAFKVGRTTEGEVLKEKPEFEDLRRTWEKDG
jgi:uncharacterized protein (TIGR00299 family) protein